MGKVSLCPLGLVLNMTFKNSLLILIKFSYHSRRSFLFVRTGWVFHRTAKKTFLGNGIGFVHLGSAPLQNLIFYLARNFLFRTRSNHQINRFPRLIWNRLCLQLIYLANSFFFFGQNQLTNAHLVSVML